MLQQQDGRLRITYSGHVHHNEAACHQWSWCTLQQQVNDDLPLYWWLTQDLMMNSRCCYVLLLHQSWTEQKQYKSIVMCVFIVRFYYFYFSTSEIHPPPTPTAPDDNMYQTSIHNRIHLLFVFQSSWDLLQTVSLRLSIFWTYRLWISETVSVLVVSAGSEQAVSLSLVPPSVSWRAQCFWASRRRKKNSF